MTQKYRGALSMWADSRRMRWHLVSLLSNLPNAFASQHHPGVGESGGPKALIFVLDSGANCDHPDSPKWYRNPDGSCGFVFGENPPRMSDEQGHGTPIAGIIGMRVNNGVGGRGIAPDTEIVPMKLYSNTSGAPQFTVTAAINKIFDMKRDEKYEGVTFIVNLSQGSFSATPTLDGLFLKAQALGILFVVSAGNEKTDLSKITRSPCSLAEILDNTTCVASTSREDELTTSNYDSSKRKIVTVGAPGVEILSMYGNNGYRFLNGSSFATPLVAGIYALGFNVNPGMGIKEAKLLLMKTSKDVPGLHGKVASGGVVNAEAFVRPIKNKVPVEACESHCYEPNAVVHKTRRIQSWSKGRGERCADFWTEPSAYNQIIECQQTPECDNEIVKTSRPVFSNWTEWVSVNKPCADDCTGRRMKRRVERVQPSGRGAVEATEADTAIYQDCSESPECRSAPALVDLGGATVNVDCLEGLWTDWKPLRGTTTTTGNTVVSCETVGCQESIWRTKMIIRPPKGNGKPCRTKEVSSPETGEVVKKQLSKSGTIMVSHMISCSQTQGCFGGGAKPLNRSARRLQSTFPLKTLPRHQPAPAPAQPKTPLISPSVLSNILPPPPFSSSPPPLTPRLRPPPSLSSPNSGRWGGRKKVSVHQRKAPERPRAKTSQPSGTDDVDCIESLWTDWKPTKNTETAIGQTIGQAEVSCETVGCQGVIYRIKTIIQQPKGNGKPCRTKEVSSPETGEVVKRKSESGTITMANMIHCAKTQGCSGGGPKPQKTSARTLPSSLPSKTLTRHLPDTQPPPPLLLPPATDTDAQATTIENFTTPLPLLIPSEADVDVKATHPPLLPSNSCRTGAGSEENCERTPTERARTASGGNPTTDRY
eukprot:GHVQ01013409.1.p1 GENE.GHVQ01013409.1~~GHVQ01013409.1.p1  ORF type:complete len:877 (+),score=69.64 GHVQ01013409.1:2014-4644(+)